MPSGSSRRNKKVTTVVLIFLNSEKKKTALYLTPYEKEKLHLQVSIPCRIKPFNEKKLFIFHYEDIDRIFVDRRSRV